MTQRMSREAFHRWVEEQGGGQRYERATGQPVAMSPEKVGHARVKAEIWSAFRQQLLARDLPCEVLPDGITVEVGDDADYEPDVVVNCGPRLSPEATAAPTPVIIVEVLSRGTKGVDVGEKFADYFRLPSLRHYLLVSYVRRRVIHHRRQDDGTILSAIHAGGVLTLDPPGLDLDIDEVYRLAEVGV
ncbi:Uma2 family endonuclease [Aerophototrophica crusticola]|uniref:Uma2 family endonuclease n=1 Tax=Aerophototrophica crusticola TaxID=1709002 RepID=A0A858R3G5_9PROT|nr:Uma2 family endonuclease [Rhodospirillaceae bacterium B3]